MADLIYTASPVAYNPGQHQGKGFLFVSEGMGELDFAVSGVVSDMDMPLCAAPGCVGLLDAYASIKMSTPDPVMEEVSYIVAGEFKREDLEVDKLGLSPLRTLFVSDVFGRDIPGGKTLYAIELSTDIRDVIYIGVSSQRNPKDGMTFRKWKRVIYPHQRVRPVVSGTEFRVHLYTKGAGRFNIYSMKAWVKLTDRRGFNAAPGGKSADQAGT